ncbi:MAG: hypothetical protein MJZ11_04125 [Lachnospiraceae bacterium]|nr:hypothetical protein [Lachnospiraceae bacterium]
MENMTITDILQILLCFYFLGMGVKMLVTGEISPKFRNYYTEESVKKFAKVNAVFYFLFAVFFALMLLVNLKLLPDTLNVPVLIGSAVLLIAGCIVYVRLSKKMLIRKSGSQG